MKLNCVNGLKAIRAKRSRPQVATKPRTWPVSGLW